MHLRASLYALLILGATPLMGAASTSSKVQSMRYRRPEPPPPQNEFSVGFRYQFAPDVRFGGFGNVAYSPKPGDRGAVDGSLPYQQSYSDGIVVSDVKAHPDDPNQTPYSIDGKTGNYSYYDPSQRAADGSYVDFHRYSSEADPAAPIVVDAEGGSSFGYELLYRRYFDRKRRLALLTGFAFNGFNNSFYGPVEGKLTSTTHRYFATDGNLVPELAKQTVTNEDGTTTEYPVDRKGRPYNDGTKDRIDLPGAMINDPLAQDVAVVDVAAHLRSAVYNLRVGPWYELKLGKKFEVGMGLGLVTQYYSTEFRVTETLNLNESAGTQTLPDMQRTETISVDEQWLVGAYADVTAAYRITKRVDFYLGMQLQTGGDVKTTNEERFAEVDYNTQLYLNGGFSLKF